MPVPKYKNQPFFSLWGWVSVISIVVMMISVSHMFAISIDSLVDENKFNLPRLEEHKNNRAIIALGSSLTRLAYEYDNKVDLKLNERGIESPFIRISTDNASRESYENILTQIAESKPSLVFIELEMLYIFRGIKLQTNKHKYLHDLIKPIKGLKYLAISSVPKDNYGLKGPCVIRTRNNKKTFKDTINLPQQNFTTYPEPLSQTWLTFFETIKVNGGQVILIEMGRSDYATKGLTTRFKSDFSLVKNQIKEKSNIDIWKYPGPYSLDYYCDLAHLNTKGTENFMKWFLGELRVLNHD